MTRKHSWHNLYPHLSAAILLFFSVGNMSGYFLNFLFIVNVEHFYFDVTIAVFIIFWLLGCLAYWTCVYSFQQIWKKMTIYSNTFLLPIFLWKLQLHIYLSAWSCPMRHWYCVYFFSYHFILNFLKSSGSPILSFVISILLWCY